MNMKKLDYQPSASSQALFWMHRFMPLFWGFFMLGVALIPEDRHMCPEMVLAASMHCMCMGPDSATNYPQHKACANAKGFCSLRI